MTKTLTTSILDFWLAVEYLQPASAPKADPKKHIWDVSIEGDYPWQSAKKKEVLERTFRDRVAKSRSDENKVWQTTVFAGLIDMKISIAELQKVLGNTAAEAEFRAPEPSAMFTFEVDRNGFIMSMPSIGSFAWAAGRILEGGPGSLTSDGFSAFETKFRSRFVQEIVERSVISDEFAKANAEYIAQVTSTDLGSIVPRPVNLEDVKALIAVVAECAGYSPLLKEQSRTKSRLVKPERDGAPSEDDIINSFVAPDLEIVRAAIARGDTNKTLSQYLAGMNEQRVDVVRDVNQAIILTQPEKMPLARWPDKNALAFAQQAGVNALFERIGDGGIFSINGPPGTGKTTLLRDVVAGIVLQRAEVLAGFSSPDKAYGDQISIPGEKYGYYALTPELDGFGIVVTSANNAAVENVTRELPALSSMEHRKDIRYFADVANTVASDVPKKRKHPDVCWGTISAVLGSKEKRSDFIQKFWMERAPKEGEPPRPADAAVSLYMALDAMEHTIPSWAEARESFLKAKHAAEQAQQRCQHQAWLLYSHDEAVDRYNDAMGLYHDREADWREADSISADADTKLEQARERQRALRQKADAIDGAANAHAAVKELEDKNPSFDIGRLEENLGRIGQDISTARRAYETALGIRDSHLRVAPSAWDRLFSFGKKRAEWESRLNEYNDRVNRTLGALEGLETAQRAAAGQRSAQNKWQAELEAAKIRRTKAREAMTAIGADDLFKEISGTPNPKQALADKRAAVDALVAEAETTARAAAVRLEEARVRLNEIFQKMAEAERTRDECLRELATLGTSIDALAEWRFSSKTDAKIQLMTPWKDGEFLQARDDLFAAALRLHEAFLVHGKRQFRANMSKFVDLMWGKLHPAKLDDGGRTLWNTFFLAVPLVSTTFASFGRLFSGLERDSLGWVLIDEAGQATPQLAAGALWRAKRAVVVGDPLQVEPVMTVPKPVVTALAEALRVGHKWDPSFTSVQILADEANPLGTWLTEDDSLAYLPPDELIEGRTWVGSPLRVHRRCLTPMFNIANRVAYNGLMVYGGQEEKSGTPDPLGASCWIDVAATASDGHWIADHGKKALEIVRFIKRNTKEGLFTHDGKARLYIISPFRKVADEMKKLLVEQAGLDWADAKKICGTVHTFQGKEADMVVFLLGGDPHSKGAINGYAGKSPNILNVAVTRAKRRLYVLGDRRHWAGNRYYGVLAEETPPVAWEAFRERLAVLA